MVVGDSVSRYQFLELAEALETGLHVAWAPPTEDDKQFLAHPNFYVATTERLGGHGACDCFRPDDAEPHQLISDGGSVQGWGVLGNRYYRNPELRLQLTFQQILGKDPISIWHEPRLFGVDCQKSSLGGTACGANRGPELPCVPGHCNQKPYFVQPVEVAVKELVSRVLPDVLIVNSGLWGVEWSDAPGGNLAKLLATLDWAKASGNVSTIVWKTTTSVFKTTHMDSSHPMGMQREELVVDAFRQRGWPVFDAGNATRLLAAAAQQSEADQKHIFVDNVHFRRFVYRGLNELLLAQLCPL
jgi:hypothetical protein